MLEFRIAEIPEEHSRRVESLTPDELELDQYHHTSGEVEIEFYRTLHFIRVNFTVRTDVELICDRSLDKFLHHVEQDYEVVFKVDVREELEDEQAAVRRFDFSTNTLSIEEEVRDTVLLNLPLKKLHPRYLDEQGRPTDFETRKFGDAGEEEQAPDETEPVDPRWNKLKQLKNQSSNSNSNDQSRSDDGD